MNNRRRRIAKARRTIKKLRHQIDQIDKDANADPAKGDTAFLRFLELRYHIRATDD